MLSFRPNLAEIFQCLVGKTIVPTHVSLLWGCRFGFLQRLVTEIVVLYVFQMLLNGLLGVKCLGTSSPLGERFETLFYIWL